MKKYFLFFLIVSLGCNQITLDDKYKIIGSGEYITLTTHGLINPKSNYITYYGDHQNCWLFYGNSDRRELIIYKLPSGEIEKRIQFDSHGPDGIGGYRGVLVHNFDSIFLISSTHYNSFFLTDTTGKVKRKYTLGAIDNTEIPLAVMAQYSSLSIQNIFHKNRINLSTRLIHDVNNENLHAEVLNIDFDLKEGQIIGNSNYPVFEKVHNVSLYAYSRAYNGEQFIYSFRRWDDIYVYNIDGSYSKYSCRSKYRTKSLDWVNNPIDPMIQQQKSGIEKPLYSSILFDNNRKYTYRFFLPGYNIDETEYIQKHRDYPNLFTIMILDDNFSVLGETLLPEKTYDPLMKFVGKDGLYLALHIDHPLYNPDSLAFERMEIIEQ